jgi:isopenicillin-N epimerase
VHVPLSATAEQARRSVGAALSPTTSLLVLDQITSSTARRLPVSELSDDARAMGVTTLVDGAHAPGLLPQPLDGLRCDAWIGNLHKFGCAPHGSAALVAPGPVREHLFPLIDSWGAPEPFPARFDTQGTIDATSMLAAPAALEFIESTWGWDRVRSYLSELADYAETRVAGAFEDITGELHSVDVGMPVSALRLVRLPDGLAADLVAANELRDRIAAELRAEVAVTSFGGQGYLRLSAHVYNTAAHYDYVADVCVPALCRWAKEVSERRPPAGRSPEPGA